MPLSLPPKGLTLRPLPPPLPSQGGPLSLCEVRAAMSHAFRSPGPETAASAPLRRPQRRANEGPRPATARRPGLRSGAGCHRCRGLCLLAKPESMLRSTLERPGARRQRFESPSRHPGSIPSRRGGGADAGGTCATCENKRHTQCVPVGQRRPRSVQSLLGVRMQTVASAVVRTRPALSPRTVSPPDPVATHGPSCAWQHCQHCCCSPRGRARVVRAGVVP